MLTIVAKIRATIDHSPLLPLSFFLDIPLSNGHSKLLQLSVIFSFLNQVSFKLLINVNIALQGHFKIGLIEHCSFILRYKIDTHMLG